MARVVFILLSALVITVQTERALPPWPESREALVRVNAALRFLTPREILRWAVAEAPSVAQVTSFGPTGIVILDHLEQLGLLPQVPVVTIDTLHLFPQTYELVERARARWEPKGLALRVAQPFGSRTAADFAAQYGERLWETDAGRFAELTKVMPLRRALDDLGVSVWITGRRRSQGGARSELEVLELDPLAPGESQRAPRYKLNPLAAWNITEVWTALRARDLPYNTLHNDGYVSIGDAVTTSKVASPKNAPSGGKVSERAGRWFGKSQSECGIHGGVHS
jgi:phosphoadenosine phosphosulfate reductase